MQTLNINNFKITTVGGNTDRICYIPYPFDILDEWAAGAAKRFNVSIVIITHIDWDNDLTPWKAKGVPTGSPDFKGMSSQFLSVLKDKIMPQVEKSLKISPGAERTLAGDSLSGLFALWQWMECDLFTNIISLSGSFWYEGFVTWIKSRPIPKKTGRAYFLLGNKEAQSRVPQFRQVQTDTLEIVNYLSENGINDFFELVPGNHYQYGEQRLNRAFNWMFNTGTIHDSTNALKGIHEN